MFYKKMSSLTGRGGRSSADRPSPAAAEQQLLALRSDADERARAIRAAEGPEAQLDVAERPGVRHARADRERGRVVVGRVARRNCHAERRERGAEGGRGAGRGEGLARHVRGYVSENLSPADHRAFKKFFTASTWDHIGLVVKFGSRHVFILEYAGGVYLYPLFTRLYTYYAVQGRVICLRRLLPGQDRTQMQKKVELFVRNVLGKSPPSISELLTAFLKQEGLITNFISSLNGEKEVQDSLETMFCSKLLAAIYKDIGLLAPHRASADFLPKHFSAAYDGYLDLQNGAILGPELPINFESVRTEIDALREQLAEVC